MPHASLFGALLIGGLVTTMLYGIACLQCFNFLQRNPQESRILKVSVYMLWTLCTCHVVAIGVTLYVNLVQHFGSLVTVPQVHWSTPAIVIFTILIALLVHYWYCYRVWILSDRNAALTYPLLVAGTLAFVFATASFLQLSLSSNVAEFQSKQWISYVAVAWVTITDVYVAVALSYFLLKHRRGVMPQTHQFVNMLLVYVVSTGALTSVAALGYVFLSVLLPQTYIWWAMYFILGEIYANSFMAWLNAREHFRRKLTCQAGPPTISMTSIQFAESMLFMNYCQDPGSDAAILDLDCEASRKKPSAHAFPAASETESRRQTGRRRSL
ncbi:hypothetical protein PsYK624_157010 [Phanerochaete sordida]|uniref:DUF6534 domain-containing protein n=1 Tax=Phanerochaete sordida TaxID=48140 RepID=A0A9P3GPD1_9APHY|nr:hypothetical protein PsYK624_157010 [Phanerochaete sordida]